MSEVMVNAHNPMTGPRNLAHYFCIKDYLAAESQKTYDSYYVIDDLSAFIFYPGSREKILNRAFFTVRDFMAAGVDPYKSSLVLTSMLPEALELCALLNLHVDLNFCNVLFAESFTGSLLHYQRQELGLPKYPSVTEVVHTQTSLPAFTLGLGTTRFTGGEEMLGYMPMMEEMVKNFNAAHGETLRLPKMELVRYPFVLGVDGRHMMSENAVFLSAPSDEVRAQVHSVSDNAVLAQWYAALDQPALARGLPSSGVPTPAARKKAADFLVSALSRFREYRATNEQILEVLRRGAERARPLLAQSILRVRGALGLPPSA
jgi:tryptophanyl-tRNA synthetase